MSRIARARDIQPYKKVEDSRFQSIEKARKIWDYLCKEYEETQVPLEFNFKENVREILQEEYAVLKAHYIHPYPGKIFPYIPAFFLSIPQLCPENGKILDPFSGSGTILLESLTHPLFKRDAYGVEINPLGRLISKVKTTPLVEGKIDRRAKYVIDNLRYKSPSVANKCPNENISFWFPARSISRLSSLFAQISKLRNGDYKDFFFLCFSSIVRRVSLADPFIPPPVVLNIKKYKDSKEKYKFLLDYRRVVQKADIKKLFNAAISQNKSKLLLIEKDVQSPCPKTKASIIWDDAKSIKKGELGPKGRLIKSKNRRLNKNSIDLIMTSPPYLTAQKYIRTHKLELQWLNMLSHDDLSVLQKNIIGAERVSHKRFSPDKILGVPSIDQLVSWAALRSVDRAATIYCYFEDMRFALMEMHRVLKDRGYCIIVLGNNHVLGKFVETHNLLKDLALEIGFELRVILKDRIRGRGMITKRHNSGGLIKEEYVIVLQKGIQKRAQI